MSDSTHIRFAALYLPIAWALLAALLGRRRKPRLFAATLLSTLWTLPTLLLLQRLNLHAHWWTFHTTGLTLLGMPLEFYLGWVVLWGIVPPLTFRRLQLPEVLVIMGLFDLFAMNLCHPVLDLGRGSMTHSSGLHLLPWLTGEALALALILTPAFLLARWTIDHTRLNLRATLQIVTSGLLFLYFLPEVTFALRPANSWQPLLHTRSAILQLGVQLLLGIALLGVTAVAEFAHRGLGTPIPYDPPQRLVTSGIYRYIANPMQLSCALVMLGWAAMLHSPWFALAAILSTIYSAGIAHWDESADLSTRFGPAFAAYQAAVPNWRIRWRPFHSGPHARLYIASTCGPCSELRAFLESRSPLGLDLIPAETLPTGSIRRLRYDPADGTPPTEGVRALARALEHLNFGWAYCGFFLRLPLLWQFAQLLGDATGLGPRVLESSTKTCGT